jgi:predicted lactoylglutathione lyase
MTTPTTSGRALFVTLPVADVARSTEFFSRLGFRFDPAFGDASTACMLVGEQATVMLGARERFEELSPLPAGDPTTHALALFAFAVGSREEVDTVADAAIAGGGREAHEPEDHGFMYARAFYDLDGHGWQVMWFDPAAQPAEVGATEG